MAKSFNDFIEDPEPQNDDSTSEKKAAPTYVLEGDLEVMPDCQYKSGDSYSLRGLGDIFNGPYRVKRATHTIDATGYHVQLTMTKSAGSGSGSGAGSKKDAAAAAETRRPVTETQNPKSEQSVKVNKETGAVS